MSTLLLTGASGRMGTAIRPALAQDHDRVRLFARDALDDTRRGEEVVLGTLEDFDAVARAAEDVDVIVHLGGKADEASFPEILSANIVGTYNVFEAARRADVRRVVYASSHHVTGFHPVTDRVSVRSDVRPDTYYGVSKVFGEALGRLYHDKWGLEVVCLRIGVCREEPESSDQLRTWLSVPDSIRLVRAAVTNELENGYLTVYGVSDNAGCFWDTDTAEQLGFFAQDSADAYEASLGGRQPFSTTWQGGAFTDVDYRGGIW
ncbi:NAD(P)-dependent oxidoreductase [Ornithinimicrobium humiphilum]|uniref:Uronate dehydrogenase n=1 Tax=Ornithinimicrobium humiphilum TaxID=125288 RepID=A0A543KQG4_9MICO|nr:NAD(P)-dependent oxidoreductase [Ornithinimicrobium humiphilum]TQM97329.1 uronate dehydrogenase [Ornithinimicrobium humiphilum]